MVCWDNPAGRAEFPRALAAVRDFKRSLREKSPIELMVVLQEITTAEILFTWKLDFLEVEVDRRLDAWRALGRNVDG